MKIGKKPFVLLVDPDAETLASLYSILDQAGCLVATRHPDTGALRYAADNKPDVALVGRHPENPSTSLLPLRIRGVSPKTRVVLFDPAAPWVGDSRRVRALLETVCRTG